MSLRRTGRPPYPLHRLDMNTSGVVLFGKQPDVVAAMHDQFRDQLVSKQYLALCMGVPKRQAFSVDVGIGQHASLKWEVPQREPVPGPVIHGAGGLPAFCQVVTQNLTTKGGYACLCCRIARVAAEDGLPSCTHFWVVGTSAVDFTQHAGPGELVADVSSFDTRHGSAIPS